MKKVNLSGIFFMSLFMISYGFAADETVTTAGKPLTIEEFTGADDAYLEPTMFPNFYNDDSENTGCATTDITGQCNNVSEKDRWTSTSVVAGAKWAHDRFPYDCAGCTDSGEDNYSNCAQSKRSCDGSGNCVNVYFPCKENGYNNGSPEPSYDDLHKGEYQDIPGLSGTVQPAKGYRNVTKVFLTWTVRVEGSGRLTAVWPFICHPHHGASYQEFPAGPLKTQLYVKGVKYTYPTDGSVYNPDDGYIPVGQIAEMTVPSAKEGKLNNPGDPTITGSYVLTPSDFAGGRIPKEVDFAVRWYNKTSMRIKSPANQRNLIVSVFPITDQKE